MKGMINSKKIFYFLLFLYLIAIFAHQLGTGFDAFFVRFTFILVVSFAILNKSKFDFSKQSKWTILFWGYYFISILWSNNYSDGFKYINNFIQILLLTLVVPQYIEDENDIKTILRYIIIATLYSCVLLIIRTPAFAWGTERVGAVIGANSNNLGKKMAIGTLFSLFFINSIIKNNEDKRKYIKLLFYGTCFVLFTLISLFTGSKKSVFIILFGIMMFEFINSQGIQKISKFTVAVLIVSIVIYSIFNIPDLYRILGRRLERTYYTINQINYTSKYTDNSLIERQFYISEAKKLFKRSPIIGNGANGFVTHLRNIGYKHVAYSHNNFWELLSTLGIIGFSIYYYFVVYMLIQMIKIYKKKSEPLALLLLIILAILIVLDYGTISYISDFTTICFLIINKYIRISKERSVMNE